MVSITVEIIQAGKHWENESTKSTGVSMSDKFIVENTEKRIELYREFRGQLNKASEACEGECSFKKLKELINEHNQYRSCISLYLTIEELQLHSLVLSSVTIETLRDALKKLTDLMCTDIRKVLGTD